MGGPEEQRVSVLLVRSLLSGQERFAVTGASGWLGQTALELLARALGPTRFRESVTGFASANRVVTLRDGMMVHLRPLEELPRVTPAPTHLLHFAFLTRDRLAELGLPAFVLANLAITATVVGAIEAHRPLGVFTTSSGAVYASDGSFVTDVKANPYGALKYIEELAVRRAAADAGGRSIVTRIFSLGGAYMTKPQLYALGDLVLQALAGGPIKIRASGRIERSYCAATDVVTLGLCCLLRDSCDDLQFDSGGEVIEVGQLAQRVRSVLGLPDIGIERPGDREAADDRYVGDGSRMLSVASHYGVTLQSLDEQVRETASYLATALARGQQSD